MPPDRPSAPDVQTSALLDDLLPGLVHGFTGDLGPSNNSGFEPALGALLRRRLGHTPPIHALRQVHSADLVRVPVSNGPAPPATAAPGRAAARPAGDGALLRPGAAGVVAVQTADCVPILAVNVALGTVAALHAGWRGAAAGILPRLLRTWRAEGTAPDAVRLAFGPSIRGCCYEVGADCVQAFVAGDLDGALETRAGATYLDLARVLRNQALAHGLPAQAVDGDSPCTFCTTRDGQAPYASYRRAGRPAMPFARRNASYIGMLAPPGV